MGGTEKFLQIMAACVDHDIFEVDYYTTDEDKFIDREHYLTDHGVNVIKFKKSLDLKYIPNRVKWGDLWKKFNKSNYDVIQITNFGWEEYPYNGFNETDPICEFCVFPPYIKFPGVKHTILNSEWVRNEWVKTGGNINNSTAIPVPVEYPTASTNLRKSLNIPNDAIVCGMHQRNDDRIYSGIPLAAFGEVIKVHPNIHFVLLNGSEQYRVQAGICNIKNVHFIDYMDDISPFLNTLDIYTHGRYDGETYGMALAEAMIHKLPCISHVSPIYNAMESTIKNGGYVVYGVESYISILDELIINKRLRIHLSNNAFNVAKSNYTYDIIIPKIEKVWQTLLY
jgi:hypothetical protein